MADESSAVAFGESVERVNKMCADAMLTVRERESRVLKLIKELGEFEYCGLPEDYIREANRLRVEGALTDAEFEVPKCVLYH